MTIAVNLSAGLALSGFKVLLVDTDTQGQDGYMLGIKPAAGLSEYLIGEVKLEEAVVKARDNLWVLAGGKSLAGVKRMIDRKEVMLKYVLPTFLDKRVNSPIRLLKKLSELYGEHICKPIRYNVSFSEAPAYGQTIYEFAPGSNGTEDYRELVRQVADDAALLR